MEIVLNIDGNMYDETTVGIWQVVWHKLCSMAYTRSNICRSIVIKPGPMIINNRYVLDKRELSHSREYSRIEPLNRDKLTLEYMWKKYSHAYGNKYPEVVPELKELVVPYSLFVCLGVNSWFRHSFPNCKVRFWEH